MAPSVTMTSDRLSACLDELSEVDTTHLSDSDLAALVRQLSRAESRVKALRLKVLATAERSQTARHAGDASTAAWAATLTRTDHRSAQRDTRLAQSLEGLPATEAALAAGLITPDHALVISRATSRLPDQLGPSERSLVEKSLLARAETLSPERLRRAARRAIQAVEPDTSVVDADEDAHLVDEEARALEKTRLTFHDNGDGTVSGRFTVPTLPGHLLRKIIETITAPRRGRLGASRAQVGHRQRLQTDWNQARGLALCELIEHLPTDHLNPRTAATIVVTVDDDALRGRLRAAGLDTGDSISSGQARRLACNAGILPAVLGGRSRVLDVGRLRRLFDEGQRVAVGVHHETCAADGCERPFAWCELHHRTPWSRGGRTDLDQAVPLCHFHHRRVHDTGFSHRVLPGGTVRFTRRT